MTDASAPTALPTNGTQAAPPAEEPQSAEFLRELVDAMRGVAESSRDASLAELRTTVESRVETLRAAAADGADELRRRSELDIAAIGDWERDEAERIRAEAEGRRDARRQQLEQQLAEQQSASDREVEATRHRLEEHERDLAAFFQQLAEITDPAAFVAAARRMPQAPEIAPAAAPPPGATAVPAEPPAAEAGTPTDADGETSVGARLAALGFGSRAAEATPASPAEPGDLPDETPPTGESAEHAPDSQLADRLAELDAQLGASTAAAAPAATATEASQATQDEPVAAPEAAPEPADEPAAVHVAVPAGSDTSTAIVVKGLGSFGAITSFKQALERVEGIRGVTLSLGPTGEFVYRASHGADFDLVAAIRTIEGEAATIERAEGSLQVSVSRTR